MALQQGSGCVCGRWCPPCSPFFVLSAMLTSSLDSRLLRPLGRLCGIPQGAEAILLAGLLGGYPVGAQAIGQAYRYGQLEEGSARRMLMFCSNAGPAFIFGIVAAGFSQRWTGAVLWLIHITSALLVGALLPGRTEAKMRIEQATTSLTAALRSSVTVLSLVCGWIVLMRVLMAFLEKWFLGDISEELRVLLMGALELTNGCCALKEIGDPGVRFIMASALLGFGGLCVALQTASVTGSLGIGDYIRGKLLQTIFSIALSMPFATMLNGVKWARAVTLLPPVLLFFGILAVKMKNKCSNPRVIGV